MTDYEYEPILALHRLLDQQTSLEDDLNRIARMARDLVKGVAHVGVTVLDNGNASTAAATDAETLTLDEAQYRDGDGPCLHAYRKNELVEIVSMETDERWPSFAETAVANGVRGSFSVPLMAEGQPLGALNLYVDAEGPLDELEKRKAASFGEQASIALANALSFIRVAELTEQLREALSSRDLIGQAKGILMARHAISADEAFDRLRNASQMQNRKLRSVAEDVTQMGELSWD